MSKSRTKGTSWETALCVYLRANGFPLAERRALAGNQDRGDLTGIDPRLVVEAKNVAVYDLAGWVAEANVECSNAGARYGVVWARRKGKTSPGAGYVIMDGENFMRLLKDALE